MTNPLASSSQMVAFVHAMRLETEATRIVRDFGNHCIAMRPTWRRIDELQHKCDAGTITAAEACEWLKLERDA